MNTNLKFTDEQNQKIVRALTDGIAATKHHKKLTSRVTAVFQQKLDEAFGCRMLVNLNRNLQVWGAGVGFTERFSCYTGTHNPTEHWSEPLLRDLQRNDLSDYMEREETEKSLYNDFAILDADIKILQEAITRKRALAAELIAGLPIPKAAKLRAEHPCWNDPSDAAKTKFQQLFPK